MPWRHANVRIHKATCINHSRLGWEVQGKGRQDTAMEGGIHMGPAGYWYVIMVAWRMREDGASPQSMEPCVVC
jgi:hypothetical protein